MEPLLIKPDTASYADLVRYNIPRPAELEILNAPRSFSTDQLPSVRRDPKLLKELTSVLEELYKGHPICLGDFRNGSFRHLLLLTYSGPKISGERGIIALARYGRESVVRESTNWELVFFPAKSDLETFIMAGASSRKLGPSDRFPGSVGLLRMELILNEGKAVFQELQSSVRHKCPEVKALLKPENLANKYFPWRFQLLQIAFDAIHRTGIEKIYIGNYFDSEKFAYLNKPMIGHELIKEFSAAKGYEVQQLTPR